MKKYRIKYDGGFYDVYEKKFGFYWYKDSGATLQRALDKLEDQLIIEGTADQLRKFGEKYEQ